MALPGLLHGQGTTLPFDWSTRPKDPGQSVNAPTLQLGSAQQVTIKIIKVNDIFYSYGMSCSSTPKDSGLNQLIQLAVRGGLEAPETDCDKMADALVKSIEDYLATPSKCGTSCTSVALDETVQKLMDFRTQIDSQLKTCTGLTSIGRDQLTAERQRVQTLLDRDHMVTFPVSISPDYDYTCTITEYFQQQPTKGGTLTILIKPANTLITLSLGPLFSAIRNRSYSSVTIPNADSTGTNTVLGVQGDSFSSAIAALVNLRLPIPKLNGDKFGIDLAAGPVVRFNSKSGSSPAGFFAGLSLRLYRYVFLTPGVHVGDFADFPQGFAYKGQPLPPNFPTPTAVSRTTAKFGVAITFQTKDFSALAKSTATATNPPAAGANAQQSDTKTTDKTGTGTGSGGAGGGNAGGAGGGNAGGAGAGDTVTVTDQAGDPVQKDLGALGAMAITKKLTLKNGSSGTLGGVTYPDVLKGSTDDCKQVKTGGTCSLQIKLNPTTSNPPATILIGLPDGTQQPLNITWSKAQ